MSITVILILITLGVSFYAWNREDIMYKLIMDPYSITKRKEYYRFITSGFIHADYMHLFFNMYALWSFGSNVEYIFLHTYGSLGAVLYIAYYILGLVVSDLPSYLKNKHNYNYSSLGASGAISALILTSIIFNPLANVLFFFIPMKAVIMGALYIAYSYYMDKQRLDNVGHSAHLTGAIFGIVVTLVLFPYSIIHFKDSIQFWIQSNFS